MKCESSSAKPLMNVGSNLDHLVRTMQTLNYHVGVPSK